MKIENVCNFYASKYHLSVVLYEYLRKNTRKEVITFFEDGINEEIKMIETRAKHRIKNKINFTSNNDIQNTYIKPSKNLVFILKGSNLYLKEANSYIKEELKYMKNVKAKIINCYDFEQQRNFMKAIHLLLCATMALSSLSCTNYLDIKPYGRTIPKTAEEFSALLHNHLNKIDVGNDRLLVGNASQTLVWDAGCGDDFETCLTEQGGSTLVTYVGNIAGSSNNEYYYRDLYAVIRDCNLVLNEMEERRAKPGHQMTDRMRELLENAWDMLAEKCVNDPEFASKLQIRLAGKTDSEVTEAIRSRGLGGNLVDLGYLPHDEVVAEQMGADILILPLRREPEYAKVLPGKIFEYLAAGRPVLGIGQEDGAAAEVLRDSGAGEMFGWDRRDGLKEFICGAHDGASCIGKYSRRVLTEKLVELL